MLLTVVCLLVVSCSNDEDGQVNAQTTMKTGKTLVVYYSYTGNSRDIVTSLTSQIEADVLEIQPAQKGLKYEANGYALGTKLLSYPAIDPVTTSLSGYATIIIVTPLWWSQMAAIMQAYLFSAGPDMAEKNIGLIVSSASSGISGVVNECKRLVPDGNYFSQNLWINNSNRSNRTKLIQNWLSDINYQQTTAIREAQLVSAAPARVYDLSGRQLVHEPSKGVFIKDGKKIVR